MYLCKENVDLVRAERILNFSVRKLSEIDSPMSNLLKEKLELRIKERRDATTFQLLNYLQNPSYIEETFDCFGEIISKSAVRNLAISLLRRLYQQDYNNIEG